MRTFVCKPPTASMLCTYASHRLQTHTTTPSPSNKPNSTGVLGISFDALGTLVGFRHNKTTAYQEINTLLNEVKVPTSSFCCQLQERPLHFTDPQSDVLRGGGELGASYFAILGEYAIRSQQNADMPDSHKALLCGLVHHFISTTGSDKVDTSSVDNIDTSGEGATTVGTDAFSAQFKACCMEVEKSFREAYKKRLEYVQAHPQRAPQAGSIPLLEAIRLLNTQTPILEDSALLAKPIVGGCCGGECTEDWMAIAKEVFDPIFRRVAGLIAPTVPLSEEDIVVVRDQFLRYLVDAFATSAAYRILPESRPTLEGMYSHVTDPNRLVGVPITIVTNNDARLKHVMKQMELAIATGNNRPIETKLFDALITTHDIGGIAKPSPIGILKAMLDTLPESSLAPPTTTSPTTGTTALPGKVWLHVGDHKDDEMATASCSKLLNKIRELGEDAWLQPSTPGVSADEIRRIQKRLSRIAIVCDRVVHVDVVGTSHGAEWKNVSKWL